jgi:MarR family transcriptional regulator, transcriptional regulator for hemolysin
MQHDSRRSQANPNKRSSRKIASPPSSLAGEELSATYRRDLQLGYLVHDVSRMRRKAFDQLMKPLGITRAQWWVIAFLARQDGMMQTQLANILDTGKASLGSLIDRLEASKWVERQPDPIDRRAKRIYLTRKSAHLLEEMRRVERDFNDQILRGLSARQRDELIKLLSEIKLALVQVGPNSANGTAGFDTLSEL